MYQTSRYAVFEQELLVIEYRREGETGIEAYACAKVGGGLKKYSDVSTCVFNADYVGTLGPCNRATGR